MFKKNVHIYFKMKGNKYKLKEQVTRGSTKNQYHRPKYTFMTPYYKPS